MVEDILEKILKDLLLYYLGLDEEATEKHLREVHIATKERIATINDLQVIIFSNDHNPPHFHVKTKNLKIEDCELLSGTIDSKNLKKIKAFYLSPKGKAILSMIWDKRNL